MTQISMKHLRYVDALLRHRHFGRAAQACHISQPALSLQVRELEDILGVPLIERGPRHVRPTSFGEVFAARAGEILRAVEELRGLARSFSAPFTGLLRVGVIPTVAPYLLPRVLRELSERHPELDFCPREAITGTLVSQLLEGQIDAALLALPVSEPALVELPLFDEEFLLVRPAREAGTPVPDEEALRASRLLMLEEGHCFRDQSLAFCGLMPSRGGDLIEGSSLSTLVQLVGAGLGVTLIPQMASGIETRSAQVTIDRLPEPRPRRTIGLVWRRSNPLTQPIHALGEIVRAVMDPTLPVG